MDSHLNDQWELSLYIDDFDLRLTPVLRPNSSTRVEISTTTQNPNVEKAVRLIPGPAEKEEIDELESQVCGNVTDQEDQYKLDEEALNLALEKEARETRAKQEWLENCRQEQELDEEHERQLLGLYV
ncbi:hypothetical protein Tco_0831929 [Tanacetum coccineum]